nr:MAG TPA: hypothetical protein [Bacteriophage sp.]
MCIHNVPFCPRNLRGGFNLLLSLASDWSIHYFLYTVNAFL